MREPALLVLEDGTVFSGKAWGKRGRTVGEIVFSTAMTGYQEIITDPSYHRQIIVMTAPHIGNTGVNAEDSESDRAWAAGLVVRDAARRTSSWRATGDLEEFLISHDIVSICDVDTRAVTRHIREKGSMRAGIFSASALPIGADTGTQQALDILVGLVADAPAVTDARLMSDVSTKAAYRVEPAGEKIASIVAVDLGMKSRTPWIFAERGVDVTVVPETITLAELTELRPDGVFFSNGPGDPMGAEHQVELLRGILDAKIPFFGVCLGNQLLARALGFGTYKLPAGHRGTNHPVRSTRTGQVEITTHNHGFAADVPVGEPTVAPYGEGRYGRVAVSHVSLNDGVVEGIECLDLPAFSVQYHPEAAAGTHDGEHIFDRFISSLKEVG